MHTRERERETDRDRDGQTDRGGGDKERDLFGFSRFLAVVNNLVPVPM